MSEKSKWKIPVAEPNITLKDAAAVVETVRSTWISGVAPIVRDFEDRFSHYCDCKYGVATNSGTTALHLALKSLGIGEGDEVIVPDFTMIACSNAIRYCNAKPVLVDVDPETWCINPELITDKITDKTKAIMPVHIYGNVCDMDSIMKIAKHHDLLVIEDAAEAHGATHQGNRVGSIGDCGCFSFFANKIVTTGEGGMVTTNNKELAERMNWLRAHAFGKEGRHYWHDEVGYGYRMSGLQAALGYSQMDRITDYVKAKQDNAMMYMEVLGGLAEKEFIRFPVTRSYAENVYWMFIILIDESFGLGRDEIYKVLQEKYGIELRTTFVPLHLQPCNKDLNIHDDFPVSTMLGETGLNLPSATTLTGQQIAYVSRAIKELRR